MIIITDYELFFKSEDKVFIVLPGTDPPPCPCCGGILCYRDSRERIRKREGGEKEILIIRRLQCSNCNRLHNELPDCLVPYKHYGADVISGVLDEVITPDDDDAEDYPCVQTMGVCMAVTAMAIGSADRTVWSFLNTCGTVSWLILVLLVLLPVPQWGNKIASAFGCKPDSFVFRLVAGILPALVFNTEKVFLSKNDWTAV